MPILSSCDAYCAKVEVQPQLYGHSRRNYGRISMEPLLKLGLPKGSLQEATLDLFHRAGFRVEIAPRSYLPSIDDDAIQCVLFRAQEMARYVMEGVIDCGITGYDWVQENEADVHEISELAYSKTTTHPARWVLAVPNESSVQNPQDLAGGLVATELVRVTRRYFAERNIEVKVEFSWGSTEVKARFVDAIVDVTETGTSLQANNLRVVDEVLVSTTRLIANHQAWENHAKQEKMTSLNTLLQGAATARSKVGLKLNAPKDQLAAVLEVIGSFGEHSPTVSPLADERWVALEIILDERTERDMIPALQRAGASGLVSYPLNKVIS